MTLVHDPARVPDGTRLRRITASIQGARAGRGVGAALLDVWYAAVAIAVFVGVVLGVAQTLHLDGAQPARGAITGEVVTALVVLTTTGALLSVVGRLGPVGLGGGAAGWWLPLPVDRRALLRPVVVAVPAVATLAGALAGAAGALLLLGPTTAALTWAATGAAAGGAVAGLAALGQVLSGGRSTAAAVVGDALMVTAAVGLAVLALVPDAGAAAGGDRRIGAATWVAAAAAMVALASTAVAERRTGEIAGEVLRARGSVGDRAQAAVLSLDLRELGRALAPVQERPSRRSLALRPGGPRRVVVLADALLVARTPRVLVQVTVATLLAVAASRLPVIGTGLGQHAVWLVTGYWAASAVAGGARHADLVPALERALPLSARAVRALHGVLPLAAALTWAAVVIGVQVTRTDEIAWLALAPGLAVAVAAAALRGAYKPPFRAPRLNVSTPMGGVPATGSLFHGLDLALGASLPTAVALFVGRPEPWVVGLQVVLAGVAVAVAVRPGRPGGA